MPRVRRRAKSLDTYALDFYQVMSLMIGWRDPLKYPFIPLNKLGYTSLDQVKAGWELHRDNLRICQWLDPEDIDYRPGRRPWAWWQFDSDVPRNYEIPQSEQLAALGVLEDHEEFELERIRRRKFADNFTVPEPKGGFMPLPEVAPLSRELMERCEFATEKVRHEPWFRWVAAPNGLLSPADADAVLTHKCYVDLERGFFPWDFIETFCRQWDGEWEGQFIELTKWQQRDLIVPLFGWVRPNGFRRFREASIWIAKKNGKSTLCGAIECYAAVGDGEGGPRVFSAAVTKEQADIVHGTAANMVANSPELSRILENKDSKREIHLKQPGVSKTNSVIKALAADANSNEGKQISFLMTDELHAWKDSKFFGALKFGKGARRQPLNTSISTMGEDLDSLGGERFLYTKKIVTGDVINFAFFGLIYEAPVGLDYENPRIFLNPEIWKLANPSLGITLSFETFYDELVTARATPKDWSDFLRYKFNLWVGSGVPYLSMADWYKCSEEEFEESFLYGRDCYSGLDMSVSEDTTALVHVFSIDELFYFLWRCWIPEETVEKKFKDGDTKWRQWVEKGNLIEVPGPVIDPEVVLERFKLDCDLFNIKEVAFDQHKADWLTNKISDTGVPVVKFGQNYGAYDFATKRFKSLSQQHRFRVGRNSAVDFQASSLSVKTGQKGDVMPMKRNRERKFKIDTMSAGIMGFDRILRQVDERSIYEDKDKANPFPVVPTDAT